MVSSIIDSPSPGATADSGANWQTNGSIVTMRSVAGASENDPPSLVVECGRNRARIVGAPFQESPSAPPPINGPTKLVFEAGDFARAVHGVSHAVAEDNRPALNGILLERQQERQWRLVASDGFRTAIAELTAANDCPDAEPTAILPANAMRIVARSEFFENMVGTVSLEYNADQGLARFAYRDLTVVTHLNAERYPAYQRLAPDTYNAQVVVSREDLRRAIQLGFVFIHFTRKHSSIVLLESHGDELRLRTWKDIANEGEAIAAIAPVRTAGITRFAFQRNYLEDAVHAAGSEFIAIETTDPKSPAVLRDIDGKRMEAVMPAMIQWD